MSKEADIISAYEYALSDYLYVRWPFRHTEGYGVNITVVDNPEDVSAIGYIGKDSQDDPCSYADIQISTGALYVIGIERLIFGNHLVLHAKYIGPSSQQDYQVVWVKQDEGYGLKTVKGFIVRDQFIETDDVTKAYALAQARESKTIN